MKRLVSLVLLILVSACTLLPPPQKASQSPIVQEPTLHEEVDKLIVLVPGAMASIDIFNPVLGWDDEDSAILAYRFPGLDGLPLDHRVDIHGAAQLIADAVAHIRPRHLYLIGFSTGGPIALETARRVDVEDVNIALISTASSFPATMIASVEGAVDVVEAFVRSGGKSLNGAWLENYRTLLYGRQHYRKPQLAERSKALADLQKGHITSPSRSMGLAHTSSLLLWGLEKDPKLARANIGVFHGGADSVFSIERTRRFARKIPADRFFTYPDQGHLLFVTAPTLFDDIHRFFGLE